MKRLNGWQRLWVVFTVAWLAIDAASIWDEWKIIHQMNAQAADKEAAYLKEAAGIKSPIPNNEEWHYSCLITNSPDNTCKLWMLQSDAKQLRKTAANRMDRFWTWPVIGASIPPLIYLAGWSFAWIIAGFRRKPA